MDQIFKIHKLMTERQERLQIENYALLTESATDLRGRLEEWYDFYEPTTPGECELHGARGDVVRSEAAGAWSH